MADQHGSGPLTPGDPLGGGTPPPQDDPQPPREPAEPPREPQPPAEPPPPAEAPRFRESQPPREPEPAERWGLGGPPEPAPGEPGGLTGQPVAPPEPARSGGPPIAPPAPEGPPAARPGSFAPPGYGTSPVPPGAFAPPVASGAREPWVLAEWWRRAAAAIIDGVIVTVVALILLIPFAILGLSIDTDGGGAVAFGAGFLVFLLLLVVASFLYAPVLMARTNGQTLGKMATDIRVVRANGRAMDFGWAFLREVVVKSLVFGLLSSFTVGLASLLDWLWPLWDGENRALHDLMVDTRVIRA